MAKNDMESNGAECIMPLAGYIGIVEVSPGLFRGGLLLTDLRGKPLDFRCTSAIKPNSIQRVLYGDTLLEHMALDICGLPLLKALPKTPAVLLVDRPEMLVLRPQIETPLIWIRRQSELQSTKKANIAPAGELIASESGLFETVLASCHADHIEDLADTIEWLRQIGKVLDPLEPFVRIAAGLKLVQDKAGAR
jgi:hypothetical protein